MSEKQNETAKVHRRNLKIFFSRTTGLVSTKLGTIHLWLKGIQFCSNEELFNYHRWIKWIFSSFNQSNDIIILIVF